MRNGRPSAGRSGRTWRAWRSRPAWVGWILLGAWTITPAQRAVPDGKVYAPVAFAAQPVIPDQRALICYSNGIERLVVETRFLGAGTNFAWVIPLPAKPTVEQASTGLFPTLDYLFRPRIIHDVPAYFRGILALVGVGYLLLLVRSTGRLNALDLVACLLVGLGLYPAGAPELALVPLIPLICGVVLVRYAILRPIVVFGGLAILYVLLVLPALAPATSKAASAADDQPAVAVLDRRWVGLYETTTVASKDPRSLQAWLRENGFAIPATDDPVVADYIRDGWVFVAAKIRRDATDDRPATPHPLSFTFPTERPVYPMRLTGVDNGPVQVDLYVFGDRRARALRFRTAHCSRPAYPQMAPAFNWSAGSPESPNIVHPLLRRWVSGAPVATRLSATLSPADMRQDVWIDWVPFSERRNRWYSRAGAAVVAANWGSAVLAAGLATVVAFRWIRPGTADGRPMRKPAACLALLGMTVTAVLYLALPKIEVRLVQNPGIRAMTILYSIASELPDDGGSAHGWTRPETSARAREVIRVADTNAPYWNEWATSTDWANWRNHLLGGPVREEDSPGNYTIREHGGRVEFVAYDAQGAEHILADLPLRSLR